MLIKLKKMKLVIVGLTCILMMNSTYAQTPKYHSEDLIPVADLGKRRAIGVSVSSDNRLFVSFPNQGEHYQYGLTEIIEGKTIPYPNVDWNAHQGNPAMRFVNVQDIHVDAEDNLWVLDSKPASRGSIFGDSDEVTLGQFKLLKIDLSDDKVVRVYTFDDLDKTVSGLNDVRVDTEKGFAYLSDPGQAAIVVLDLMNGSTRTVLVQQPFTVADPEIVLTYEGREMRNRSGTPFRSNVNGIALTKDNKYFYFKPINKHNLYRIETRHLTNAGLSDEQLAELVEDMGKTVVTHGSVADQKGNIFLTASESYSIMYLAPDGILHTLVQDSRLIWPDSLGIGTDGYLYFSCAQLQLDPQWNDGKNRVEYPYQIYKVALP